VLFNVRISANEVPALMAVSIARSFCTITSQLKVVCLTVGSSAWIAALPSTSTGSRLLLTVKLAVLKG